jgi:tetratricopeptide (TPR) repeat protein
VQRHPGNLNARQALVRTLLETGSKEQARAVAEATYSVFPEESVAVRTLGAVYLSTGDVSLANTVLARACEADPDDGAMRVTWVRALLVDNQPERAQEVLESIPDDYAEADEIVHARAFCAAMLGSWDAVREDLASSSAPVAKNLSLRMLAAAAAVRAGDKAQAVEMLSPSDGMPPVSPRVTAVILRALGREVPVDAVQQSLVTALRGDDALLSDYLFARACFEAGYFARAGALLSSLAEAHPQPQIILLYLASIQRSPGISARSEEARAYVEAHARIPAAWLAMSSIYGVIGDADAQMSAVNRALALDAKYVPALQERAQLHESQGNSSAALKDYASLVAINPDNGVWQNNLAYTLLTTGGDVAEALTHAQRAREILGARAEILHTLGLALLANGQVQKAGENLVIANNGRYGDPTLLLDLGRALIAAGEEESGVQHVRRALQYATLLSLDFPRRGEAEEILAGR